MKTGLLFCSFNVIMGNEFQKRRIFNEKMDLSVDGGDRADIGLYVLYGL